MYRRDLIKGLVAVPFAASFGNLKQHRSRIIPTKLIIILEGPFVIVLHKPSSPRIQVFTAMDKPHYTHVFFLNDGQYRDTQADKLHDMKFSGDGNLDLKPAPTLSKPCLNRFNYTSSKGPTTDDDLIQIDLPSPDQIYCAPGFSTPVRFESDAPKGPATDSPSGHVLEYGLRSGSTEAITISDP